LANLNDSTFRTTNMKGLDPNALQDPKGANNTVANAPAAKVYSYQPSPTGCDNGAAGDCTSFVLTATLEAGGTYVKNSLN